MQARGRENTVDLWFVTNNQTHKLEEIQNGMKVYLNKKKTYEFRKNKKKDDLELTLDHDN